VKVDKKKLEGFELLAYVRTMACESCGRPGPSDPDHTKTRATGGPDLYWNVVALCRECHTRRHKNGPVTLMKRSFRYREALEKRGWTKVNYFGVDKLEHPIVLEMQRGAPFDYKE